MGGRRSEKAGVVIVEETVVRELIIQDGFVKGVKTELEDYYANIVVLADGVNSLLAKQVGLRGDITPDDVALSVKEVIKLPEQVINDRFHVNSDEGCIYEILVVQCLVCLGLGLCIQTKTL